MKTEFRCEPIAKQTEFDSPVDEFSLRDEREGDETIIIQPRDHFTSFGTSQTKKGRNTVYFMSYLEVFYVIKTNSSFLKRKKETNIYTVQVHTVELQHQQT